MIALLLSSSVLVAQTHNTVSADKAPVKKELSKDQLKMLDEAGYTAEQLKAGTLKNEDFLLAEKLLKESKFLKETYPKMKKSSTYSWQRL